MGRGSCVQHAVFVGGGGHLVCCCLGRRGPSCSHCIKQCTQPPVHLLSSSQALCWQRQACSSARLHGPPFLQPTWHRPGPPPPRQIMRLAKQGMQYEEPEPEEAAAAAAEAQKKAVAMDAEEAALVAQGAGAGAAAAPADADMDMDMDESDDEGAAARGAAPSAAPAVPEEEEEGPVRVVKNYQPRRGAPQQQGYDPTK